MGEFTATTIDLLKILDAAGNPVLVQSVNWSDYLDVNPDKGDFTDDQLTVDGCTLSEDLDLMLYVKGEQKGARIYDAQLLVEYDDPNVIDPPPVTNVDLFVSSPEVPKLHKGQTGTINVGVTNVLAGAAAGTLTVTDAGGILFDTFVTDILTSADSTETLYSFSWTAPSY